MFASETHSNPAGEAFPCHLILHSTGTDILYNFFTAYANAATDRNASWSVQETACNGMQLNELAATPVMHALHVHVRTHVQNPREPNSSPCVPHCDSILSNLHSLHGGDISRWIWGQLDDTYFTTVLIPSPHYPTGPILRHNHDWPNSDPISEQQISNEKIPMCTTWKIFLKLHTSTEN